MNSDCFMGGLYFIAGLVMGSALLTAIQEREAIKAVRSNEILKLHYSKDDRGNCFASEPHSQRFTWVPCDGQTLQTK